MRTAKVLDRLKAEQAKNPDVPHYDSMGRGAEKIVR